MNLISQKLNNRCHHLKAIGHHQKQIIIIDEHLKYYCLVLRPKLQQIQENLRE